MSIEKTLQEAKLLVKGLIKGEFSSLTTLNLFGYEDINVIDEVLKTLNSNNIKYINLDCRMLEVDDLDLKRDLETSDVMVYNDFHRATEEVKERIYTSIKLNPNRRRIILGSMEDSPSSISARVIKQWL